MMQAAGVCGGDPCAPGAEPVVLLASVEEANASPELFRDGARAAGDNAGPFLVVVDDFYRHPHAVRDLALQMEFFAYSPPSPRIVSREAMERFAATHSRDAGTWLATAVVTLLGEPVEHRKFGRRFNPEWLRRHLSHLLAESIDPSTWQTAGDYWNGAFHLIDEGWSNGRGRIHHHFKAGDLEGRGWSGVVYLSEDPPPRSGTSIWRDRASGVCVAPYGRQFHRDVAGFELACLVENRFNRLVLFRENVLHRAERGFGHGRDARLTQTFFFRCAR